nr:TetR family transcriptional regulator C-terminal domain-containing protein [Brevibacterium permense]
MANPDGKNTGEGTEASSPRSRLHAAFSAVHEVGNHGQRSRIWIELVTAARTHASLQDCVDSVFEGWRSLFSRIICDGIRTGDFTLGELTATEVVDTFIAIIDGFDLAAVAGHGSDPRTMTRILIETADRLLEA